MYPIAGKTACINMQIPTTSMPMMKSYFFFL
jgi:hypothetical protein